MPTLDQLPDNLKYSPTAKVADVLYVLDYGAGFSLELTPWGRREHCPVFVWRATCDLDYTAPTHVADAAYEYLAVSEEMAQLERAAGWDPNP